MPGSDSAPILPDGVSVRSRPSGTAARGALAAERPPADEQPIEPPLLRDFDRTLASAGARYLGPSRADLDVIAAIVEQLDPIMTRKTLLASFAREADPNDELVRAAYRRAWMRLPRSGARRRTHRARIAASMPMARKAMTGPVTVPSG